MGERRSGQDATAQLVIDGNVIALSTCRVWQLESGRSPLSKVRIVGSKDRALNSNRLFFPRTTGDGAAKAYDIARTVAASVSEAPKQTNPD
jgi:hypothetical protein